MTPQLIMLCGVPTSGKSTYIEQFLLPSLKTLPLTILSTDSFIESQAEKAGSTYNALFDELIGPATEQLDNDLRLAIRHRTNIIWDQTNLTPRVRKRKLARIPTDYEKIAVWFDIPLEEVLRRNETRPGKVIPKDILKRMHATFIRPTKDEGFDQVIKPL